MACPNFTNENLGGVRPQIQIYLTSEYTLLVTTRRLNGLSEDLFVVSKG